MDIDLGLLGAVCREGMSEFLNESVTVEMLDGSAVVAFKYIENHWKNYRDVPTIDTVYKETGLNFHTVPVEPMKFWSDQIKKRHLYETIKAGLEPIMTFMEEVEPHKVVSEMESLLFKIRSEVAISNRPEPMFANPEAMFEDYEQSKLGITGVPTPWPTLNKITRGWQPADFALIAARPSQGKTWVLLIMAIWAWENGKKVLLGSTEMSHQALRRRAAALFCRLSYSKIRDGTLTADEEAMFREKISSLKDDKRFIILGDGFDVTLNSLEAAIIEEEPDLVGADGAYLFKGSSQRRDSRHESIADVFNGFKQIAKRNKVPIIGTTQMNRPDKQKTGAPDLSRMAFSDNAGMVADWVFFLKQTKEMKQNREMELQPGKMREADFSGNIRINFDFGVQNFTEVEDTSEDEPLNKAIGVLDNMEFPSDEDEPF